MFSKKKDQKSITLPKTADRYDRLDVAQLVAAIEAAVGRGSEVFRGFSHGELDQEWVVAELDAQLVAALGATRALARKVEAAKQAGL